MKDNTFRIGLCMAGAVSAGAYTAGVMDYLLEALEEWEKRKGQPGVPTHKVAIPVMGGASAGGMTTIITASALANPIKHVGVPLQKNILNEHPENRFYNTWVDLLGTDMFSKMLKTDDIKDGCVISLLNSQFIDDIANKITAIPTGTYRSMPAYFEAPVKIFTTLSNLEGFDYNTNFNSAARKEKYTMTVHNDYACFAFYDTEEQKRAIPKGWIPLNFKRAENADVAKNAAMATGAFPVGLKSRVLKRDADIISDNKWNSDIFKNTPIPSGEFVTLNVDGGLINNEPFEKVRDLLDDITLEKEIITFENAADKVEELNLLNTNYDRFVNTVLMIDPFPTKDKDRKTSSFELKQDLMSIIGYTFSTMMNQMRVKPQNYRAAMLDFDASQFIISPSRHFVDADGKVNDVFGEKAIACGALGGFSGFISKEFRVHDYYLGRFNCEIFLRDYFTVPASSMHANAIFRDGYINADKEKFKSTFDNSYQIIPIFTPHPGKGVFPMPVFSNGNSWPLIKEEVIDNFRPLMKTRAQKMLMNMMKLNFMNRILIFAGAKVVLNRMIADKAINAIKGSFDHWKLLIKKDK